MSAAAESPWAADRKELLAGSGWNAEVIASELNQRFQVLTYEGPRLDAMVGELVEQAGKRGYGKIFLKAPAVDREALERAGLETEATITGYFDGADAAVMAAFVSPGRREQPVAERQEAILTSIRERPADPSLPGLPGGYSLMRARPGDSAELARLYSQVFASYPFPITDPEYLSQTMQSHIVYRLVRDGEGLVVAAASAETDPGHANSEMTDFATLPSQRGLGLAQHILAALEQDMAEAGIPNLYTIARARSFGMNRVFYNRGYLHTGTLINNCHISGQFEDMHVWCKVI